MRASLGVMAVAILLAGAAAAQTAPPPTKPAPSTSAQAPTTQATPPPVTELPPVEVIGASPLIGSGIDRNTVPAETQVLDSNDLKREGTPDLLGSLNQQVGGVSLDSASGNPFQPTFFYHGFAASGLQGTPQGLAVYVNGVRFNQPFGDTVDWDLIPAITIDKVNLEGSNPVFGLNALGGAVNVQLKNGFTWQGLEADISGGSFGQIQGEFQYGKQAGNVSTYVAGTVLHQNGWRDLQSTDLQNVYGDVGWRSDLAELHVNITAAHSVLNGPGTSPVQLLAADPSAQFTAPNQVSNQYAAVSLNGTVDVTDSTSIQALVYYRYFLQRVTNGNAPNDTPCNDGSGLLCSDSGPSTTLGGAFIPDFLNGGPYSELDKQTTNTNAYGASAQVTNTNDLFSLKNHFIAGVSFDGAQTLFSATSFIGGLTPDTRVFIGPGVVIDEPGTNSPVRVAISNATYGLYFADTLNLTSRLAVTVSGRFNAALVDLNDQNGGDLTGNHSYNHFNPAAGVTYQVAPWMTAYAGYAVANRAPTPAELSCAGPTNSCSLANFFVGDPNLQQVISYTAEAGVRGTFTPFDGAKLNYNLGLFHTDLNNDIAFINSVTTGRAFFANIGETRRQGVDVGLQLKTDRWLAYIAYTYTDATFQSGFTESAGSNPAADANGNITIQRGNRLPGIPVNQVKLGVYYKVTDKWTVGATAIGTSTAFLFGDETNLTPPLPGYFTVNVSTSYQLTDNVQLFAWAENITNTRYDTFGTFSPTSSVFLAQAPGATNPRSLSPAAPIGGFGGVRISF
ncbi:MAG TPA: TonB-dependent receptor [Acetobacteraceae bacterium]|nr:TonB-dependent receptor [Acetobacteraceae bacterium]